MHRYEELLRREYGARAKRDMGGLAELFADDIVWHVPGRSAIAGHYRGKGAVMEYVRKRQELAGGTFEVDVEDVLANDHWGLVIATGRVRRGDITHEWRAHGLYRFRDGKIAECWVLPEEQYRFDAIWS